MSKYFIVFVIVLIIGFSFFGIFLPKDISSSERLIFQVEKGEGSKEISINLEKQGLIRSGPLFRVYVLTVGVSGKLQAGTYQFSSSMSVPQIVKKLVLGEVLKEEITIIEGWNLRDIGFYFEDKGMFQAEEFWEIAGFPAIDYSKTNELPWPKDFSSEYQFLSDKSENVGLEGYLFPDTYEINTGAGLEEIIRKMLENFDRKLVPYQNEVSGSGITEDLREEIEKQGKSIFEIVTMASLLEKEVKSYEDKKLVAGILWKRKEVGMPLQVDATISYITGEKTTEISKEQTQIDSPYNTYKYTGLPLGPICNPGLESIKAVLYHESSEYWYYLSAPEGDTIFSKTLKEHNIAKAKYLK